MKTFITPTKQHRAFLGISHTPLFGVNPVNAEDQQALDSAISQAKKAVLDFDPELVILIGTDHYNTFFNELMPPFCLGTEAEAIGDFFTPSGHLNVPKEKSIKLASHLIQSDFDIAISHRMRVDHGFSQAIQFIWGDDLQSPPIIPIFFNAVAQPGIARVNRCKQLGKALGNFLDELPERTLLIGSGGLSHEPPVPTLAHPDPIVRERITIKHTPSAEETAARVKRVKAAGMALANGDSSLKPLNPEWDLQWMDALEHGSIDSLCSMSEESISLLAGNSAHESKTWLIARSAMPDTHPLTCSVRSYRAMPALIAGYGILFMHT